MRCFVCVDALKSVTVKQDRFSGRLRRSWTLFFLHRPHPRARYLWRSKLGAGLSVASAKGLKWALRATLVDYALHDLQTVTRETRGAVQLDQRFVQGGKAYYREFGTNRSSE